MGRIAPAKDGFSIRGIAPPELRGRPDDEKRTFHAIVVVEALKEKDRELARGLDRDGKDLRGISPWTRRHRRSAMTPTGKGDPSAPPLTPGRALSRTRSLLTGKPFPDRAELFWRYDPFTYDSWAAVLRIQAKKGRDVFGLSPAGLARVTARSWAAYRKVRGGPPAPPRLPEAPGPIPRIGTAPGPRSTAGIGAVPGPGEDIGTGGLPWEKWLAYLRRPTRPGSNVLLDMIRGRGGPGGGPATTPGPPRPKPRPKPPRPAPGPKPAPRPKPEPGPEPVPTSAYTLDVRPGLSPGAAAEFRATIEALPPPVLDALRRHGARFVVAEDMAAYDPVLAAEVPRGWPDGMTWANAEGLYRGDRREILAARTRLDPDSGAAVISTRRHGVLRHETGHAFDSALGGASFRADFAAAYAADVATIDPESRATIGYYLQGGHAGRQEAFAEVFAQLHGGGAKTSLDLAASFPACARLIREWASKGAAT